MPNTADELIAVPLEAGRLPRFAYAVVVKGRPPGGGRLKTVIFTHMRKGDAQRQYDRLSKLHFEECQLLEADLTWRDIT